MAEKDYTKETLEDGIIVFTLRSVNQEIVDDWYRDVAAEFQNALDAGRSTRFVYDIHTLGFPTPYLMQRARDLANLPLPHDWRVATVIGSSLAQNIVNFIRSVSLLSQEMYERSQVFNKLDEALAWLRQGKS